MYTGDGSIKLAVGGFAGAPAPAPEPYARALLSRLRGLRIKLNAMANDIGVVADRICGPIPPSPTTTAGHSPEPGRVGYLDDLEIEIHELEEIAQLIADHNSRLLSTF